MQIILHIGPNKHWSILYYELTPKEHDICGFEWYLYVCVSRCIAWTLWRRLKNPWRHCHSLRAHVVTQTGLCHAILSTRAQWVGCSLKNSKRECSTMCHKYGYPCFRQFGNGQKRLGYLWMETHKFTSAFLSWETSMKNFVQVCRSVFLGALWKDVWLIEIWCYQKKYELHDFRYCCLLFKLVPHASLHCAWMYEMWRRHESLVVSFLSKLRYENFWLLKLKWFDVKNRWCMAVFSFFGSLQTNGAIWRVPDKPGLVLICAVRRDPGEANTCVARVVAATGKTVLNVGEPSGEKLLAPAVQSSTCSHTPM